MTRLTLLKILPIILLLLGEGLSIYAELVFAKLTSNNFNFLFFIKMLIVLIFAGLFLLLGYYFGYSSLKNIWVVGVISIVSILLMEPIIVWLIFKEIPTTGAIVGFILGGLGLISSLVW